MFTTIPRLATAIGALLISFSLAAPAFADNSGAAPQAAAAKPSRTRPDTLESRIAKLHDRLHITAAQTADWNALAQLMRDNAKTIHDLAAQKRAQTATMTAVDDLNAYAEITAKHAELVQTLATAFARFYATLSPEQKKAADTAFREHKRRVMQGQQH